MDRTKVFCGLSKCAFQNKRLGLGVRVEKTWTTYGYYKFRKALGKNGGFKTHEESECHSVPSKASAGLPADRFGSSLEARPTDWRFCTRGRHTRIRGFCTVDDKEKIYMFILLHNIGY